METISVAGQDGLDKPVAADAVEQLGENMRGVVARPGDEAYREACAIWNGMIDKRPALVARCRGRRDVVDAVRFARRYDLKTSVRGGGHNVAGHALCDGGLGIDLSPMNHVHVEAEAGRVRVGPGCRWRDVDRETGIFGQAVPNGIISTTGVAGLTLGGGFGWLSRRWGLTCDHLVSADVVTAQGSILTASRQEHSELFWGLRGGGGNFGVVTSFEFRTRPIPPEIMAGIAIFPREHAAEAYALFRRMTREASEELSCLLALRNCPPVPFVEEEWHGEPIAGLVVCHCGPLEEARQAIAPVREHGDALGHNIESKPFLAHQQLLDAGQPSGRRYYWKSEYVDDLSDGFGQTLLEHTAELPSPYSGILLMHLGGAIARSPDGETAASHRDAAYVLNITSGWDDGPDEARVGWARDFWEDVQPFAHGGSYVNFLTDDEGDDRVRHAYDDGSWERLVALKNEFDPDNFFRSNQNIPPGE